MEVGGLTGAGFGEKSPERLAQHNGYRDWDWETRAGTVELRIPKLRKGSFFPGFLALRRIAEKALTAVIQEAYIQGSVLIFIGLAQIARPWRANSALRSIGSTKWMPCIPSERAVSILRALSSTKMQSAGTRP